MPGFSESALPGTLPGRGRLLGIDFGSKRVGLALSNIEQTIASPLEVYERRDERQDAGYWRKKVEEYAVTGLVVGLPVHMSGDEGEKAREARTFGNWVSNVTKLPIIYCDERYTTAMADEQLLAAGLSPKQRRARRDMLAAQILLQNFLDGSRDASPPTAIGD